MGRPVADGRERGRAGDDYTDDAKKLNHGTVVTNGTMPGLKQIEDLQLGISEGKQSEQTVARFFRPGDVSAGYGLVDVELGEKKDVESLRKLVKVPAASNSQAQATDGLQRGGRAASRASLRR